MGSTIPPFTLEDHPVENLRPLKVRVIGAGYSGIYLGIRIPQRLRNVDLQIYEKNEGVGGTWWENRYPGCACDIPAHSYQYSFEPNPNWSSFYAPAAEICQYLHGVAEKYGVLRHVKSNHKVVQNTWDERAKIWKMTIENTKTGETFQDEANVLISARGALSDISWPQIPGLESFKGEIMHSAAWNDKYDFKNKRIGVIGGGSSSIQIVPNLQKIEGVKLSCFVRSKTWISNPFGEFAMIELGLDPNKLDFTPEQREEFANNPEAYLKFRKTIETSGNTIHAVSMRGSELQQLAVLHFTDMMQTRLAKKPEIAEALVPSFGVGCRRITPGPGYLEALVEDNVDFIRNNIVAINPSGIELENGNKVDLDVIVCATGFKVGNPPPITGRGGISIEDRFMGFAQTYISLATDHFPNYWMMLGPNSGIGTGSLTMILEYQGDYIIKCIRKLQKENYATMEPKPARVDDFSEFVGEYFKKTVYMDDCNSWYRTEAGKGARIHGLWPGSTLHAMETYRAPRWEDYDYESLSENRLRWLGNGWSVTQVEGSGGDPAFYLEPDEIDFPCAGQPEDDERLKRRPFSH